VVIVRCAVGEMFRSGGFKHRRETRCKQTVKCQPEMVYGRRKKRRGNIQDGTEQWSWTSRNTLECGSESKPRLNRLRRPSPVRHWSRSGLRPIETNGRDVESREGTSIPIQSLCSLISHFS